MTMKMQAMHEMNICSPFAWEFSTRFNAFHVYKIYYKAYNYLQFFNNHCRAQFLLMAEASFRLVHLKM